MPDELKDQYKNVDWKRIKAFRNILTHEYLGAKIDFDTIKDVIENRLDPLKVAVQHMLDKAPDYPKVLKPEEHKK